MPPAQNQDASNEDTRFKLGRIIGSLEALPDRMDRFESSVSSDLAEIKAIVKDLQTTTEARVAGVENGTNIRLTALEHETWRKSGALGLVSAVIGAGLSGFLVKFWH